MSFPWVPANGKVEFKAYVDSRGIDFLIDTIVVVILSGSPHMGLV